MNKEGDEKLAVQIKAVCKLVASFDLDRLKEFEATLNDNISHYEAIGIIDGHAYFDKIDDMRARHKRLLALINFIETFLNTQNKISEKYHENPHSKKENQS